MALYGLDRSLNLGNLEAYSKYRRVGLLIKKKSIYAVFGILYFRIMFLWNPFFYMFSSIHYSILIPSQGTTQGYFVSGRNAYYYLLVAFLQKRTQDLYRSMLVLLLQ